MEFEWDETKRVRTLLHRGLDFVSADLFFDGRPNARFPTDRGNELRFKTIAIIDGKVLTLIWTPRDGRIRIISLRRSHGSEERAYRALHD